ncbi:MAG: type II toxin-antitoxin system RatA family toxin [Elusimicrobiota bacterium]
MITQDSVIIKKSLPEVYRIAKDVKNQHKYIPGYKPSEIVEQYEDGKIVVRRFAKLKNKEMTWKSLANFNENSSIDFKQLEGRLKGMEIHWLFNETPQGTEVIIIHDFKINKPVIGWFMEKYFAKPKIDMITSNVLAGLKKYAENAK